MSEESRPIGGRLGHDWVAFAGAPLGFGDPVLCRVAVVDGRVRIVDLRIGGGGRPVTARALRELPISAMEQLVGTAVRASEMTPGEATPTVTWSLDSLESFLKDLPAPEPDSHALTGPRLVALYSSSNVGKHYLVLPEPPPLDWTKGQAITDEFLVNVGRAYDAAIQRGESPAMSIATATGASQKTVHAWVYQGRRRGVIAPAQGKGRIS